MSRTPTAVRPIPSSLRTNRGFTLLWLGEGVSLLGTATTSALLPLLAVVALDAGPGWMGALAAAAWLPWLVVGLPAGAWVDRLPPRRVMIIADLAAAAALLSVPVAYGLGRLSLTQLLVVALLVGTGTVFFRAAYPVFLTHVVPPRQLESANARLFGTESAMQVAGPGLGGLLAQLVSAAAGLLLDVVSFVVSALCLARINPAHAVPSSAPTEGLRGRIRVGVDFLRRDPYLRWTVVLGGLSNFGLIGYQAVLVLHLVRDLGLSPGAVGVVLALGSAGGLVGAVVAPAVSRRLGSGRATVLLAVLGGPPALLVALGAPGWRIGLVVLGLFAVGVFVVAGNVIRAAWRQRYVPAALLGRVVTTSQLVAYSAMPLAALTAGGLGATLGIRATVATMAAVHALAGLAMILSPFRRLRDLPEPSGAIDPARRGDAAQPGRPGSAGRRR